MPDLPLCSDGFTLPDPLSEESLQAAAFQLANRDLHLAEVVQAFGPPPLWAREPDFATLVYIILEQQVSLASARAAFHRLTEAIAPVSQQLSCSMMPCQSGWFQPPENGLWAHPGSGHPGWPAGPGRPGGPADDEVRSELTRIKGIGRWTADIYLMEALLRPDVWPVGDLALAVAVQRVKRLEGVPGPVALEALGDAYRPWRAVAARLFWHHYLSTPGR